MELEGVRYAIKKNEFLFMPHGSNSRGYRASDKPTSFYHVIFVSETPPPFETYFSIKNTENIHTLYSLLTDVSKNKDYDNEAKLAILRALLYEIAYQREQDKCPSETVTVPVAQLMKKYIDGTLHRVQSVEDVAHHFGFSAKHANRLFFAAEHTTIKIYINECKVKKIKEYLMSTNISVSELAGKFGFPNASALNRFYRYHTGQTIKEFRAKFID